jgi:hypothetical protein
MAPEVAAAAPAVSPSVRSAPAAPPRATPTAAPPSRHDRLLVAGFAGAAVASWVVDLRGPRREVALAGRKLPPLCAFRLVTGRRCPGCGMTRGFLYMFRGDLRSAVRANHLTPVAFVLTAREVARAVSRLLMRVAAAPAR